MFDPKKFGTGQKKDFLPLKDQEFTSKDYLYYFDAWIFGKDGRLRKHRFSALNDPKKTKILARFVRRAIKCRRYSRINPLAPALQTQKEVFELYRVNVLS